jgi:hypothetical protein
MWIHHCGWQGEKAKAKLEYLTGGDEAHTLVCPQCEGEDLINTDVVQLRLPGVWISRNEGCPHLWQGICSLRWDICTYACQPIQYCTVFRDICHQWSVDAGYTNEEGVLNEEVVGEYSVPDEKIPSYVGK